MTITSKNDVAKDVVARIKMENKYYYRLMASLNSQLLSGKMKKKYSYTLP